MIGYTSWLLFPFIGYYLLSFFPEANTSVVILETLVSIFEFTFTFWIGIILILIVNSVLEKQPFDAVTIKQKSLKLLQPTARVLLFHLALIILGFVCFIIPGMIALVWFAFAQTAVILNDQRGKQALLFSRSLSKGRFYRVLYCLITGPFVIGFIYSMIITLIFSIGGSASGFDPTKITAETTFPGWLTLCMDIVEIFTLPWLATYMVMLYKELLGTRDPSASLRSAQDDTKEEKISPPTSDTDK